MSLSHKERAGKHVSDQTSTEFVEAELTLAIRVAADS